MILIGLGTGFVKGFAVILALGVLLSLYSGSLGADYNDLFDGELDQRYRGSWGLSKKRLDEGR